MPNIYPTIDRNLNKVGTAWSDGDAGNDASAVNNNAETSILAIDLSAYNSVQFKRHAVEFDTEDITVAPTSATLKIYGRWLTTADVICAKATFATAGAIVVGDFDSWSPGSPTAYTDELETWVSGSYNNLTLTSTALSDMASLDQIQMMCMEADNDYDRTSAGSGTALTSGMYATPQDGTGTDKDPYIDYTAGAAAEEFTSLKVLSGNLTVKGGTLTIK